MLFGDFIILTAGFFVGVTFILTLDYFRPRMHGPLRVDSKGIKIYTHIPLVKLDDRYAYFEGSVIVDLESMPPTITSGDEYDLYIKVETSSLAFDVEARKILK